MRNSVIYEKRIKLLELHVSTYFLQESEFRSTYDYHFMLLITLPCYSHFQKLPFELMLSMRHVYLRFVGLFVCFLMIKHQSK